MKKILVVAMADSVHTARWLEQFENSPDEFVLFPSSPHRRIHPKISYLLSVSSQMNITIPSGLRRTGLLLAVIDKLIKNQARGLLLRRIIRAFKPNILHAVETQGAGYIASVALKKISPKPFFILTLWGSDLFWFRRFKRHELQLQELMPQVDRLAMECQRDVAIANQLGFKGEQFPPFPVTGGYDMANHSDVAVNVQPSLRKLILVKGHTRFVGRGLIALAAMENLAHLLSEYQIVVYSADPKARRKASALGKKHGLSIISFGRGKLSHDQLLKMFKTARIYIGISLSDGISVSLQEAMAGGAFPIQTDTSCADEWIVNGQSGFVVSPTDLASLISAIRTALEDDALVNSAAEINYEVARKRLDESIVASMSQNFYEFSAKK